MWRAATSLPLRSPLRAAQGKGYASFAFASAASDDANLFRAIAEATDELHGQLSAHHGTAKPPGVDFVQLLVSTTHRSNLALAPECLADNLRRLRLTDASRQPVVVGGALQSVSGAGRLIEAAPGVSLLAAQLPGVQLCSFHVEDASLPRFSAEQWAALLARPGSSSGTHATSSQVAGGGSGEASSSQTSSGGQVACSGSRASNRAAVMFSSPHFLEVETLLQRMGNALPGLQVVGGVTERDAWVDTEHSYGALFLNREVYGLGAVGVVMQGPLVLRQLLLPGYRPAGEVMTVTQSAGSTILQLNGRPVHDAFVSLLHSLPEADRARRMQLGVDASGRGRPGDFVARAMSLTPAAGSGRPVLVVAGHEVPAGSSVRLMVDALAECSSAQAAALTQLAEALPTAAVSPPSQLGLLSHVCVSLPGSEADAVRSVLPAVPFGGGRMQGELGGSQLHSFCSSLALLHHADLEAGQGSRDEADEA